MKTERELKNIIYEETKYYLILLEQPVLMIDIEKGSYRHNWDWNIWTCDLSDPESNDPIGLVMSSSEYCSTSEERLKIS